MPRASNGCTSTVVCAAGPTGALALALRSLMPAISVRSAAARAVSPRISARSASAESLFTSATAGGRAPKATAVSVPLASPDAGAGAGVVDAPSARSSPAPGAVSAPVPAAGLAVRLRSAAATAASAGRAPSPLNACGAGVVAFHSAVALPRCGSGLPSPPCSSAAEGESMPPSASSVRRAAASGDAPAAPPSGDAIFVRMRAFHAGSAADGSGASPLGELAPAAPSPELGGSLRAASACGEAAAEDDGGTYNP